MTTSTEPAAACAGCGAALSAGALFCLSCGAPAPRDIREQRDTAPRRKAWFDVEPVPEPPPPPAPAPAPAPETESVTFDDDHPVPVTHAAESDLPEVDLPEVDLPQVDLPEAATPPVPQGEVEPPEPPVGEPEAARLDAVKRQAEAEYALLKAQWAAQEAERKGRAALPAPEPPDVSAAPPVVDLPSAGAQDDPDHLELPQPVTTHEASTSPTLVPLPDSEQLGSLAAASGAGAPGAGAVEARAVGARAVEAGALEDEAVADQPRSAAETILIEQFEERIERSAFFGERSGRSKGRSSGRSGQARSDVPAGRSSTVAGDSGATSPISGAAPELDNPDELVGSATPDTGRRWFRRPAPPREPVASSFDTTSADLSRGRAGGSGSTAVDVVPQRRATAASTTVDLARTTVDPGGVDAAVVPLEVDDPKVENEVDAAKVDSKVDDPRVDPAKVDPASSAGSPSAARPDPAVLSAEVSPSANAPRDVLKDTTNKAVPAQRSLEEDLDDPEAERRYAARYSTARWLIAMLVVAGLLGAGVVLLLWQRGGDQVLPPNPQAQAQSLQLAAVRAWQEGNAAWASGDVATVCAAYDGVGVGGLWLDRASCMASEQQGFDRSPAANRALVGRMTFDPKLAEIVDGDAVVIWLHKAMVDGQPVTLFRDDDFAVMRVLPGQGWRQVGARYSGNVVGTVPHSLAATSSSGLPTGLVSPFPAATGTAPVSAPSLQVPSPAQPGQQVPGGANPTGSVPSGTAPLFG